MSDELFLADAEDLHYTYFTVDLNEGRHEDVKLAYDGTMYDLDIRNDKPVVIT